MKNPFRKVRVKEGVNVTLNSGALINLINMELYVLETDHDFYAMIPDHSYAVLIAKNMAEVIRDSFIEYREQAVKANSPASGLSSFFGQELKTLSVEFK